MGDLKTQAFDASRLVDRGQFENARQAYAAIARNAAADPKMQLDADVSACALAIDAKYNGCGTQYWERLIEQNPDHVVANVDLALIYQRFNCERVGGTVQQCRNFIQQAFKMAAEHGLKP